MVKDFWVGKKAEKLEYIYSLLTQENRTVSEPKTQNLSSKKMQNGKRAEF